MLSGEGIAGASVCDVSTPRWPRVAAIEGAARTNRTPEASQQARDTIDQCNRRLVSYKAA
jgi:hypothetical protein